MLELIISEFFWDNFIVQTHSTDALIWYCVC